MTHYVAGFSGLTQTDGGDTIDIAERIPGAAHFSSFSGLSDWREVLQHLIEEHHKYETISLFGLSNGALSILYIADGLLDHNIPVDYLGLIDPAYGHKPKIGFNVKHVQQFWSQYAKARTHDDFVGLYEFFDLNKIEGRNVGHSEAARVPFTQNSIVEAITALQEGTPSVTDTPFYMGEYNPITDAELIGVASRFGYPESRVRAIFEIESAGKGSETSGALRHLYEPHVMWRNLKSGVNLDVRAALAKQGLAYSGWRRGAYPKVPYPRTDKVVQIISDVHPQGLDAAIELTALSCSWGLGQVLGENARMCGYDSATDMVMKFRESELAQLIGMINFIEGAGLREALLSGDWVRFAEGYNGKQQAKHNYSGRLAKADSKWVARIAARGPHEDILEIPEDRDPDEWVWERDTGEAQDAGQLPTIPPETIPEAPESDLETIMAAIRDEMPHLNETADQTIEGLLRAITKVRGMTDPPPTEGETIALPSPATEQGFFIPKTKENDMALTGSKSLFKSKTIWGLGAAAVSIFVPQLAPIVDILAPSAADVPPEAVDASKDAIQAIVTSIQNIIASASLLYAAWGRKVATGRIE